MCNKQTQGVPTMPLISGPFGFPNEGGLRAGFEGNAVLDNYATIASVSQSIARPMFPDTYLSNGSGTNVISVTYPSTSLGVPTEDITVVTPATCEYGTNFGGAFSETNSGYSNRLVRFNVSAYTSGVNPGVYTGTTETIDDLGTSYFGFWYQFQYSAVQRFNQYGWGGGASNTPNRWTIFGRQDADSMWTILQSKTRPSGQSWVNGIINTFYGEATFSMFRVVIHETVSAYPSAQTGAVELIGPVFLRYTAGAIPDDLIPPVVTISSLLPTVGSSNTSLTMTFAISGETAYQATYYRIGTTATPPGLGSGSGWMSFNPTLNTKVFAGLIEYTIQYYASVMAIDISGNRRVATYGPVRTADTTPPDVTFPSAPTAGDPTNYDGAPAATTVKAIYTVAENSGTITSLGTMISTNDALSDNDIATGATYVPSPVPVTAAVKYFTGLTANTTYYIYVIAQDATGRFTQARSTAVKTGPVPYYVSGAKTTTTSASVNFTALGMPAAGATFVVRAQIAPNTPTTLNTRVELFNVAGNINYGNRLFTSTPQWHIAYGNASLRAISPAPTKTPYSPTVGYTYITRYDGTNIYINAYDETRAQIYADSNAKATNIATGDSIIARMTGAADTTYTVTYVAVYDTFVANPLTLLPALL